MKIDPKLVQLAETYKAARDAYDVHIRQFAHPVQWPLLNKQKQQEWYDDYMSK